ncbi:MAG TPA: hypothetical protein DIV43_10970 [Erysipelotrichaceae bacterium]|nr:hypothetical protein [Erysipelotrichaceae bacterium]
MSYPHRYTVTVKDATPGQFNLIAKDFCDYYKETFSNDNIIVVEDERSMYFEDIGNERFIGFENCPAEALSRGFPEFEIEWRRLYAGDYSAVEVTYKNAKVIREKIIDADLSMYY